MKVGLSLIWDYKENGCCDIKKLRARLSENWEEINMDETIQAKSEDQISYLKEFKAAEELKERTQKMSKS